MLMIKLACSLLIPWLGGYVWLALIERRFQPYATCTMRQLGYGFFLGYATLYACIYLLSALGGGLAFWPVIGIMAALSFAGLALLLFQRQSCPGQGADTAVAAPNTVASIAARILLVWIALHLVLALVEILYQPVYPWDAWTSWIYRSRAWFYSGDLVPVVPYESWLKHFAESTYTIGARDYPPFASVIPLWVAVTLGEWQESLVNLPVLLCGIAIGLGLYGQCRGLAVPKWLSILAMYVFFSIPLVGTHLSLGGYADIWLTGFAGLGLTALLAGMVGGSRYLWLLGLAMLSFGVLVKNEGVVWLFLGLAICALTTKSLRTALIIVPVLLLMLGIASWLAGDTFVILPGLGEVGYRDGALLLPFIGENQLQVNDITALLWRNGFVQGTWHLLWFFVVLSFFVLVLLRKSAPTRAPVVFIIVLLFGLYFIFGLTEQGRWAEIATAINRLPLHLVPVFILCITLCCHWLLLRTGSSIRPGSRPMVFSGIGPAVLAALIVLAGTMIYIGKMTNTSSESSPAYMFTNPQLILGGGYFKDGVPHVNHFQQGAAIVSSGPLAIPADELPILRHNIESSEPHSIDFFWRTTAIEDDFTLVQISTNEPGSLALNGHPRWRGEISEIGLIINARDGDLFAIRELSLEPASQAAILRAIPGDWLHFEPWAEGSINRLSNGRDSQLLPLPLLLIGWSLLCLLLYWLMSVAGHERRRVLVSSMSCLFIAWCLLDVRWTMDSLRQSHLSISAQPVGGNKCLSAVDCRLEEFATIARRHAQDDGDGRVLILRFDEEDRFRPYRMKYHLLPAPAAIYHGDSLYIPWAGRTHVLVLWALQGQRKQEDALELVRQALSYRKLSFEVVAEHGEGVLIEVRRGKGRRSVGNSED